MTGKPARSFRKMNGLFKISLEGPGNMCIFLPNLIVSSVLLNSSGIWSNIISLSLDLNVWGSKTITKINISQEAHIFEGVINLVTFWWWLRFTPVTIRGICSEGSLSVLFSYDLGWLVVSVPFTNLPTLPSPCKKNLSDIQLARLRWSAMGKWYCPLYYKDYTTGSSSGKSSLNSPCHRHHWHWTRLSGL